LEMSGVLEELSSLSIKLTWNTLLKNTTESSGKDMLSLSKKIYAREEVTAVVVPVAATAAVIANVLVVAVAIAVVVVIVAKKKVGRVTKKKKSEPKNVS